MTHNSSMGALGVWTPREAHQPGARDDLTAPYLLVHVENKEWYTWQTENGRRLSDDLA